jgi:dethiobiotin synthetase
VRAVTDPRTAPDPAGTAPAEPLPPATEPAAPVTLPGTEPVPPVTEPDPPIPVSPGPAGPMPDAPAGPGPTAVGEQLSAEVAAELAAQAPEPAPAARPAESGEWRGIVLVTGTDTDVGKTIVTSAVAAAAQAAGLRVAVVKPGQTGTAGGAPTDIDLVNRLAGPHTARTLASYPEPLAPLAAARVANLPPLELYEVVDAIRAEAEKHDLVLVEGAGGLLVPMGVRPSGDPWTLADLATTLGVSTIVVARAGLGTPRGAGRCGARRLAGRAGTGALGQPQRAPAAPGRRAAGRRRRDGPGRVPPVRAGVADARALRRPGRLAGLGGRGQLTRDRCRAAS